VSDVKRGTRWIRDGKKYLVLNVRGDRVELVAGRVYTSATIAEMLENYVEVDETTEAKRESTSSLILSLAVLREGMRNDRESYRRRYEAVCAELDARLPPSIR
jgi:hypothetical protein